ncbi:MAG TPA: hypothetical protein VHV52_07230 [Gaiellaceae bacterium]|jgi:hypothetical protein|nr:hypothetical protein [Gaiellaceae bacterium]
MPAEVRRFERRLGKRDVRFLAALGSLAIVGTVAGVVGAARGSADASRPTCITFDAAGVMGGGTWRYCGSEAVAFCRVHGAEHRVAAQCAKLD